MCWYFHKKYLKLSLRKQNKKSPEDKTELRENVKGNNRYM